MKDDSPLEQLLALKRKLESARTRAARLEGELSQVMQRLGEHGIKDLKDGEAQQEERKERLEELESSLKAGLSGLQAKWGDKLED